MGKILFAEKDHIAVLKLVGEVRVSLTPTIHRFINSIGESLSARSVVVDLSEATHLDSTTLGMLARVALRSEKTLETSPVLFAPDPNIRRLVDSMGFQEIFIVSDCEPIRCACDELPTQLATESALREQVLEAHRTLMALNENNARCFKDLVLSLEKEIADEADEAARASVARP